MLLKKELCFIRNYFLVFLDDIFLISMAKGKKKSNKAKNQPANTEQKSNKTQVNKNTQERKAPVAATKSGAKSSSVSKSTEKVKVAKERPEYHPILSKENLKWVGIGTIVLVVGYLLMIGGKSPDPNVFDEKKIYSFTRISLAPILICVGFGLQMYGILIKAPRTRRSEN